MSQKVIIQPDENGLNPTVNIGDMATSNQLPVNVSYHESTTIQTHNAVSVAASGTSDQTNWMDCSGFIKLAVTLLNDNSTSNGIFLKWSNDGINMHGYETLIAAGTGQYKKATTDVGARYCKVQVFNNDTVAHTMSAWAYPTA